jgi:two-component system, OmpR family, sensor kinase
VKLTGRVHARVAAFAVAVGLLLLLAAMFGIDMTARAYHQEANQRLHLDLALWLVDQYHFEKDGRIDSSQITPLFADAMRINPTIEVYLIDAGGHILAFNAPPGRVKLTRVDMLPIHRLLASERHLPILGTDPRNPAMRQVFSVAPIRSSGTTIGYAYVVVGGEEYQGWINRLRLSRNLRTAAVGAAVVIVCGLMAGLAGFWFFTRRITHLSAEMSQFRASGFAAPPEPVAARAEAGRGSDELDQLRDHFHMLAAVIRQQLQKLHEADRQLREAIAALSHDLQTPLTALGGYLDTVRMRMDALSAEQRAHYLDLAAIQQERLTRMVRAQFELSLLDSAAFPFDPQLASLTDLAHDVAQELGAAADTAGVSLTAETPTEPVLARMDVGLMQRVLENLLSNAIRHTPRGGRVALSVMRSETGAAVCVSDTGSGIRPEDLPRVFDRSFRGSDASREDRAGGLGLAIVKRIIELHGGRIFAASTPGAGARFSFELPFGNDPPSAGM